MKKIIVLLLCLCLSEALYAHVKLKQGHPLRYTVQAGDTLWGVASRFLDDPLEWQLLLNENPEIKNPSRIYPGEVLVLTMSNGRPLLQVEKGGTVKLSPHVRYEPLDHPIPIIPMDVISPFIDASRAVNPAEILQAPYVVGFGGKHVEVGAGDKIYVEGLGTRGLAPYHFDKGSVFFIYRLGKPFVDPQTKELLAFSALHIGRAEILQIGNPSSLKVTATNREIITNDRLFPLEEIELNSDYFPHSPDQPISGQIIAVVNGVSQIGQFNVVVINRGKRECMTVGDVLAVYKRGKIIKNPVESEVPKVVHFPNERAGAMMIFRVFDKVSYGIILHATQPINLYDIVSSPTVE